VHKGAVRSSLRYSIADGVAWSVMHGAGERYITPFLILAGSGLWGLAAVGAIPVFAGAAVQCVAAGVTDAVGRRKSMFVWGSAAQALMFAPAIAAVFVPGAGGYALMLLAYALLLGFHNFCIPPWNSVMGDLVPPRSRGRWFGMRNLLIGAGIAAAFLGGGAWLRWGGSRPAAFAALFAVAAVARLVSAGCLAGMFEPSYRRHASDRFTLAEFVRRAPKGNFGRFVAYVAALHLGVGFAGPFFWWYMLAELKFSAMQFAWLGVAHLAFHFGSQPLWGRLADRIGNKIVLAIGGFGIAGIPLLWLVSDDFTYLMAIQAYDGVVWAAFVIAAGNYLFDTCTAPKRARCTAYMNLFVAAGALAGAFAGAALGSLAPRWGVAPFTLLLAVSAAGRLLPNLLLLRTFDEVRVVRSPA